MQEEDYFVTFGQFWGWKNELWDKKKGKRVELSVSLAERVWKVFEIFLASGTIAMVGFFWELNFMEFVIFYSLFFSFRSSTRNRNEEVTDDVKALIFENSRSRNSTPSFNDDDEKYRELFVFCSCWAIYKFILCDTIGKIYTVCLIKCIRIEKICSTEERYLAKRERFIPACSKLSFSPIVILFSPPPLSFHIERTRLYRLNQRFETNRMKITYEWIWLSIEKSFVQRINT